ncbi:ABC transporter substrate-binding protein [Phytohabitans rumicis]|uniref:Extracellular solute-binding protein n=1 Tax=Phytohabitans rumicis TaxID=1076125 RepID=A0A6V8LG33_9ACTN|nr:ABC transporter substrate-binding protein [Phytohabitans rumicis]GFJ96203.1 hypothetical protein Prum_098450 [Phytohabitans rumicis]
MKPTIRSVSVLLASTLALVACSSGGDDSASGGTAAGACAPSSGPVTLTFTSWIPGIEDVVKVWNAKNPNIQVTVQTGPNGNGGTYQNFFNQLKAGNAPDLGQIEYDTLPSFRVQDGLANLASCDIVTGAKDKFVDWTWNQVTFGEQNSVYAVPRTPARWRCSTAPTCSRSTASRSPPRGRSTPRRRRRSRPPAGTSPTSRRAT